jgi:lipopolysaccharide/colanic/teichoic acid biosynthesis glycosyltransferase
MDNQGKDVNSKSGRYDSIKRAFDLILTAIISILAIPFSAIIALLLWIFQRKVLFRQLRPGHHGRPFILYKFRTMNDACDRNNELLPDEERITKVGFFLRSLSLDELPQLWNVFKGEMSLVGPRPLLMEYMCRYTPQQARRHEVRPGITGWAQVNGRNAIGWEEKFALDVWYVDHKSLLLDLRILWMTAIRVVRRSGISSQKHATMPVFMGKDVEH